MAIPKTHSIKPGQTLTAIAKDYQIAGWQALYFAPCNKDFRRRNPNPDRIPAGGKIIIPIDPIQQKEAIRKRIANLRACRKEAHQLWKKEEQVIDNHFKKIKGTAEKVDAAATVALILNSLARLTYKGFQVMKLSDEALEAANKKAAKEALGSRATTHGRDNTALVIASMKKESTSTVWLITKTVAQSWCDITSPSFWANTVSNLLGGKSWSRSVMEKPEDLHRKMKQRLQKSSLQVFSSLDKKIHEAEKEMRAIPAL